ncbi:MAG TPA: arginine--tRNA ligase, partial [Nitrospiria bacterium]|nr:arginine--tRNA ligase [Nitrospiria bacterium]
MSSLAGKKVLIQRLEGAHREAFSKGRLQSEKPPRILIDIPKRENQGDYSSNLAMLLSRSEGKPAREIAEILCASLKDEEGLVDHVEVAGPGFINFTMKPAWWHRVIQDILSSGRAYGASSAGRDRSVQIEYVSANPTGPLHVGHGRWAAVGNALANVMTAAGFRVEREYYNNDIG